MKNTLKNYCNHTPKQAITTRRASCNAFKLMQNIAPLESYKYLSLVGACIAHINLFDLPIYLILVFFNK